MSLWIATLAVGVVAVASEDPASEARRRFSSAEHLYDDGRYSEALSEFEAANRLFPHPATVFDIGRCYEQLGNAPEALRHYLETLHQSSADASNAVVLAAIRAAEHRLHDRGVQLLLVRTKPPGAAVAIDGRNLGASPVAITLPPGKHRVTAYDAGRSAEADVDLTPERSLDVEVIVETAARDIGALAPTAHGTLTSCAWVPAAAASGALALAGGGLGIAAQYQEDQLFSAPHSKGQVDILYARTTGLATGANIAYGTATAAAIVALVLYLLGPHEPSRATPEARAP
jgi:tetratricopeptide (TPR) repeat protein